MSLKTQQARVDALIRIIGLLFFSLGVYLTYITYVEATQAGIVPQVVPIFYFISILLAISGLIAMLVKFK
jgi:predicted permease